VRRAQAADIARSRLATVAQRDRLWRGADEPDGWSATHALTGTEPSGDTGVDLDAPGGWDGHPSDTGGDDLAVSIRAVGAPFADADDGRTVDDSGMPARAVRFAREHLGVIAVVLAIATVFAVVQSLRSRPESVPSPTVVTQAPASTPAPAATLAPTPALIKVHVIGAVASPGVVALPPGARVEDALVAAGGLLPAADPAELNLAAVLADGCQVVIGTVDAPEGRINAPDGPGAGGTAGALSAGGATINLNTATEAQLETLPGIGPVTAGKILAWRDEHGRFTAIAELQEISGIGPKTYAQIAPYVSL